MKLTDINYPIFPIRGHYRVYNEDGIDYVETHLRTWVLDNKNLQGGSLASRRFKIVDPYPLKPAIFTLAQLLVYIKENKHTIYIDKLGKIFKYKRTKRYELIYKKVSKYYADNQNVYFEVEDVGAAIAVDVRTLNLYEYNDQELYLGLIYYNGGWLFYEATTKKKKDTWIKI